LVIISWYLTGCERNGLYDTAKEAMEGPKIIWSDNVNLSAGDTINVTFPENVINADDLNNYNVKFYGTGTMYISSITYDAATFTASLSMSVSGTDGKPFEIEIIEGPSPISSVIDNTRTFTGRSPEYVTPDMVPPYITNWNVSVPVSDNSIISITFSENVKNGNDRSNYSINYGGQGTVSIYSVTYDPGTFTAVLRITAVCTDGVSFTIGVGNISDGTNYLSDTSSAYTTTDTNTNSCSLGGISFCGYCWFPAPTGTSCESACASFLGYNTATELIAGSADGYNDPIADKNCSDILKQFGYSGIATAYDTAPNGIGCHYDSSYSEMRRSYSPVTNSSDLAANAMRACACNNN